MSTQTGATLIRTADDTQVASLVEDAVRGLAPVRDCAVVMLGSDADTATCVRCGIAGSYPGIALDAHGVCSPCRLYADRRDDIMAYFGDRPEALRDRLRARAREAGAEYDCLLLFSGGKDSTYVLYQLVDLGLRVMTFTFNNGFISRTALDNVKTITDELGIEHVTATRADQNRVFVESLTKHKSVCNGCFRSLLDLSNQLAAERGIPSIVTGLSRGQIVDERLSWFYRNAIFDPAQIEQQLRVGRQIYHQVEDRRSAAVVDKAVVDKAVVDKAVVDKVEVLDFFRYSDVTKDGIREFLQRRSSLWATPKDTGFCSTNCMINDVGVYVHGIERGFHNYESPTRWEVRLGHLSPAEAAAELQTPVNLGRVRAMLARIGYADPAAHERPGMKLAVYYVADAGTTEQDLRRSLAGTLGDALMPAHWMAMAAIPRIGAAIQRDQLPPLATTRFELDPKTDDWEAAANDGDASTTPTRLALTDRQAALFRRGQATATRSLLLTVDGPATVARLRAAVLAVLVHDPDLRFRFPRDDAGWWREDAGVSTELPVSRLDLRAVPVERHDALVEAAVDRLRARFDLATGLLVRFALIERQSLPSQVLVVVHGAVADGAGWLRLLTDLNSAWRQLGDASLVELPDRSALPVIDECLSVALPVGEPSGIVECHRTSADAAEIGADAVLRALSEAINTTGSDPRAEVRFRFHGDLAAVLPADGPLHAGNLFDVLAEPEIDPYRLTIDGYLLDGKVCLDWRADRALLGQLLSADIPNQTLRRMIGLLPATVGGQV